ncbi:MAG: hypothetical protein AAFN74_18030 [Myxococcota bacterium]
MSTAKVGNSVLHIVNNEGTNNDAILGDLDGDGSLDGVVNGFITKDVEGEQTYFLTVDRNLDGWVPTKSASGGIKSTKGGDGWPENTIELDNGYRLVAPGKNEELRIYEPTDKPFSSAGDPLISVRQDPHLYMNGKHVGDFTQDAKLKIGDYEIDMKTTANKGVSFLKDITVTSPNGEQASIFDINKNKPKTTNIGKPSVDDGIEAPNLEGLSIADMIFQLMAYVLQKLNKIFKQESERISQAKVENSEGVPMGKSPAGEEFNMDIAMQGLNRLASTIEQITNLLKQIITKFDNLTNSIAQGR